MCVLVVGEEEKCKTVKTAPTEVADQSPETKKQPDWFADSLSRLKPLFQKRNTLYSKWLSFGLERSPKHQVMLDRQSEWQRTHGSKQRQKKHSVIDRKRNR